MFDDSVRAKLPFPLWFIAPERRPGLCGFDGVAVGTDGDDFEDVRDPPRLVEVPVPGES